MSKEGLEKKLNLSVGLSWEKRVQIQWFPLFHGEYIPRHPQWMLESVVVLSLVYTMFSYTCIPMTKFNLYISRSKRLTTIMIK